MLTLEHALHVISFRGSLKVFIYFIIHRGRKQTRTGAHKLKHILDLPFRFPTNALPPRAGLLPPASSEMGIHF